MFASLAITSAQWGTMSQALNMALVGCGAIARYHLDGLLEHATNVRITACVDPDPEKAQAYAAETGGRIYLVRRGSRARGGIFDAVDPAALWTYTSRGPHIQCPQAGKHVLLEKPMFTLEACDRILQVASQTDSVFMVAENAQYWPEIVEAKKLIEAGAIGEIIDVRAAFVYDTDDYGLKKHVHGALNEIEQAEESPSTVAHTRSAPLRMWMGEIDEVRCRGTSPTAMEGESLTRALFRFQSGQCAQFDAMMIDTVFAPEPWWRTRHQR